MGATEDRGAVVLMYHRICPAVSQGPSDFPGAAAHCYFARGTAVEPAVFAAQLNWLVRRYRPASLLEVLASGEASSGASRPRCALTFDDGYRDVVEHVLPLLERWGAPVAVFPCAAPLGNAPAALWFDAYYAILHQARRRAGVRLAELGLPGTGMAPGIDEDLRFWVRGPLKERLHGLEPARQAEALALLSQQLDAPVDLALATRLYLQAPDLAALLAEGHLVGGHGVHHLRLPGAPPALLQAEIAGSVQVLDRLSVRAPRVFAYPDGRSDAEVEAAVASAGFAWALGVDAGVVGDPVAKYRVPRVNMRNVRPGEPGWPAPLEAA